VFPRSSFKLGADPPYMSPQAGFVLLNEIVPRLKSTIPQAVCLVGCEDVEELVQDATAIAAKMLHSAEAAGKRVTAGNIAYYAVLHLKAGRRSTGSSAIDAMEPATQLNGHAQLVSLDQLVSMNGLDNEVFTLGDMLSNDREDPAAVATRRLDWESFCETQPSRSQAILQSAARGEPLTELAKQHQVSRSTLQASKSTLALEIKQFMGEDILQETARLPLWKHNLEANREKLAWKKADKTTE